MGWMFLAAAIGFEIAATTLLKLSDGFSRPGPTAALVALYGLSFFCLAQALKAVPLAVAYALWSAIGIAAIAAIGMLWFGEPATRLKLVALAVIVAGVALLQLADRQAAA